MRLAVLPESRAAGRNTDGLRYPLYPKSGLRGRYVLRGLNFLLSVILSVTENICTTQQGELPYWPA